EDGIRDFHVTGVQTRALPISIDDAQRIVFFTGAGISTESGIPDFRSPGTGLWNQIKPIPFQEFVASEEARLESWRRRFNGPRAKIGRASGRGRGVRRGASGSG